MHYLYYILNKFNLLNSSIRFSFKNPSTNSNATGKIKTDINISSKNIKIYFIIYVIMFVLFLGNICLWFLFFPSLINEEKPDIFLTLCVFISIFIISIVYIFTRRHILFKKKEAKPKNINIYNKDLPDNLTPAHARLLVTDGKIDDKTLASTILDLVDRGYLKLESNNREDIFTKDLLISKTNKSQEDLFTYEKYLIDWLFEGEQINSLEVHKKLNDNKTNPFEKFSIFQGLVLLSFPLNKYYKSSGFSIGKIKKYACLLFISLMPSWIIIQIKSILLLGISEFFALFSLANMFFYPPNYLLNDNGAEIRDSYLDLKKYLTDFSFITDKTSEMIVLWNYYLSYSIALNMEGEAYKEIANFFGNEIYNLNNQSLTSEDEIQKLIDNIPNEIDKSKELYKKRNKIII